ncbi:DNase I-like protein, partial [Suillus weaverae]
MSHERLPLEEDDSRRYEPRQCMSEDAVSASGPSNDADRMEQEVCWPSALRFTSLLTVTCRLFHSEWVESGRGQSMVHERAKWLFLLCQSPMSVIFGFVSACFSGTASCFTFACFSLLHFFLAFTQSLHAFTSHISSNAFVILFGLLLLVMVVHTSHPLHIISLNANGLGDLMKCNAISSMIQQHRPHIWVINETKSPTPAVSRVCAHGYNTFENPGVHTAGSPAHGKWGVILGVCNTIHAQHVDTFFDSSLTGRVVAVDLVIPTAHGGFPHRLIGVYVPWDPGMTAGPDPHSSSAFWMSITQLCRHSPYSWSLIGDCNVTLNIGETSSRSTSLSQAQLQYQTFLCDCHAVDIWDTQNDVDAAFTYTFRNHIGQSVIDRAVHSTVGVQSSKIEVLDFFIGSTDHRPIRALLSLSAPDGQSPLFPSSLTNSSNQRVRPLYPKCHECARFIAFSNEVDHPVLLCGLSGITVADDSSFDVLYHALTDIICNAASLHFEQPRWMTQKEGSAQKIVNPTIRILVREGHRLGRLIAATCGHSISELATKAPWVVDYLNAHANLLIAQGDRAPQFLPYLLTLRRTLARIRYAEERIELHSRAQQSAQGHIRA